jgi:hypothetical protein
MRLPPHELALLNNWMVEPQDIPENRQVAVRRLISMARGEGSLK